MKKIIIALTLKSVILKRVNVSTMRHKPEGIFLWIGSGNSVDRIVGYHFERGWIADYAYMTKNHWIKDLWRSLFKFKDGHVIITRWI